MPHPAVNLHKLFLIQARMQGQLQICCEVGGLCEGAVKEKGKDISMVCKVHL